MLGLVHRPVLRKGPPQFWEFFKLDDTAPVRTTRSVSRRHSKHLQDPRKGRFPELLRRSALGLIAVYNLLPTEVVLESSVKGFQSKLQELVKTRATAGYTDWSETLSPRVPLWKHPLR